MPPVFAPADALALEIFDALMVVCTRGWQRARLALVRTGDGSVRVADVSTVPGPDPAPPMPDIGAERGAFLGVINEAIGDLGRELASAGIVWEPGALLARRDGRDSATLDLEDAAGVVSATLTVGPDTLPHRIFTEAFFDAVAAAVPEATRRQQALAQQIAGHDEWNFDDSTGDLELRKGVLPWRTLPVQIVGTYAHESGTFMWAWANSSLGAAHTRAVAAVREQARSEPGLGALLRPSLPCGETVAWTLAGLAGVRMGADGIYPASYGPGVIFFAITGHGPTAAGRTQR